MGGIMRKLQATNQREKSTPVKNTVITARAVVNSSSISHQSLIAVHPFSAQQKFFLGVIMHGSFFIPCLFWLVYI